MGHMWKNSEDATAICWKIVAFKFAVKILKKNYEDAHFLLKLEAKSLQLY